MAVCLKRTLILGTAIVWFLCTGAPVTAENAMTSYVHPVADSGLIVYAPVQTVSGLMTIAGSDTMQPIMAKLAQEFRRWHPDAKIVVQGDPGPRSLIDSLVDGYAMMRQGDGEDQGHLGSRHIKLLALSRDLKPEEVKKFRARHGYEPVAIAVAKDAVAIYVNQANPIQGITLDQLDAIFSKDRKRGIPEATSWGQLGLQDEWTQAGIRAYGRDKKSTGTRTFFEQTVLLDGQFRENVDEQPGSASVVLAVSRDRAGIGYSGIGFSSATVREVPVAEVAGQPFVQPASETVASGQYPLSRTLYLYVNKAPKEQVAPIIQEFLKFINTRQGQDAVAKAGVYPLTPRQAAGNLTKLDDGHIAASRP